MSEISDVVIAVHEDPEFTPAIKAALQEVRENIARLGRKVALEQAVEMYHAITVLRPRVATAFMVTVLFRLAEEEVITEQEKGFPPAQEG